MKKLSLLVLVYSLIACSSEVDNSEPPAPLVDFLPSAEVEIQSETVVGQGVAGQYLKLQPVLADSKMIIAGRDGRITALNADTGGLAWINELDVTVSSDISSNDKVAVIGTRDAEVVVFKVADGEELWRKRVSSEVIAKPAIGSDKIIIRSIDGQVTALDIKTGQQTWFFKRDVPALSLRGNSAPLIIDEHVFVGMDDGRLIVLDIKNGNQVWDKTLTIPRGRSELDRLSDIDADTLLDKNVLFLAGFHGKVAALDLVTGEFLWRREMSVVKNMAADSTTLYVVDNKSHIWALDKTTGATVWKQAVFNARGLTAPVIQDDKLIVADAEGYVHWISIADGHLVARIQIDEDGIIATPLVSAKHVIVISRNGILYSLEVKNI